MADFSATAGMGMFSSFLGSLTSAFGAYEGGEAEKAMYDYQAGVARMNAQIAEQNATYASQVGELKAGEYGYQAAQQLGMIKATQGSHGLDVRSGSAAQVQSSQKLVSATEVADMRSNAARVAYSYRNMAQQDIAQAGVDTLAGQNAMTAGMIKADTSIIGGAQSVSQQWLQASRVGMFSGNSYGSSNSQPFGG
jgi:hypothetical protein